MSILEFYVVSFLGLTATVVLLSVVAKARVDQSTPDTKDRPTIRRHSEYVEIINEGEDGYGIAAVESDDGIALKCFDGADEVYQKIWIKPDEVSKVADTLSVKAAEKDHMAELQS